ncbi:Translocation protein S66 [Exophiala dermatitidis]|uniref:Translocation protein SEC66 n=2 Tax=Exophiala dermatitidis TaxID=5970 RepID=H6BR79_EXODN|nr:uncharacterized protein HMPREF1120_02119 [Exophiala dermatitidis NIH/UT8656]KAJ4515708.1 Translocation protein S66 [Exophiala dermatitidis]EHY53939.1 hypothetical protein HMPREF1120_02119 [Exophiala dermatitidis NIH/UT8656]KAJ4519392.1 Translocation protein S66 [Exophiala dermatitidis]KAJ4529208.1 Translocation protein S66 [Exophiala dermatitidis]KAJ4544145.1 Translocation protein S66 [Exophiala dermatitidis]
MEYLSLLIPIAYLGILIGSMATFSHLYRQRQVTSKLRLAPYFGPHTTRNIYLSLLHLQDQSSTADSTTKVPDSILRAALLARAVEDIQRIREIQTRKPALAQLLQRGVVGDEIFQRLQRAEQELELELKDVVAEANALAPNWGLSIFQSANEMVQNKILRDKLDAVKATLPAEKEAWEAQRERSRRELLGEGEPTSKGPAAQQQQGSEQSPPVATGVTAKQQQQPSAELSSTMAEKAARSAALAATVTAGSDDEGVMVESPGVEATNSAAAAAVNSSTTTPSGGAGGGGGKNKKKKGKR